ncbi:MAG: glutamate racemase [Desulfobacteraceae bacterium]|jgi:glutamate racemase
MIGVFDSGIGGLTVVRALMDLLPDQEIIYLGDTARTPYGSKSKETIVRYSLNTADFLVRHGAKIIVIACNTASSHAYEAVRSRFQMPVFEVIGPGARLAVERSKRLKIGIIGTRATISSGIYERKILDIQAKAKVVMTPCPLLVPLVEEGWLKKPETVMIVRKYLAPLKTRQIDTLILGCTHYPVLRDVIQRKIGAQVALVDSAEAIADQVHRHFNPHGREASVNSAGKGRCRIYVTDTAGQFKKTAQLILGKRLPIEQVDIQRPCRSIN